MYNRYVRNDNGAYTRIPQEENQNAPPPRPKQQPGPRQEPHQQQAHREQPPHREPPPPPPPSGRTIDGLTGFLRHLLDQLHLDRVDTGDLLLLGLLFFLFKEDADEELLVALGLLVIL